MDSYLEQLNCPNYRYDFTHMVQYATLNQVPIITKDSLTVLLTLLDIKKAKRVLEIGTAIGYSALNMIMSDSTRNVSTIERDDVMYQEAMRNINFFQASSQIQIFHADALQIDVAQLGNEYDVLFIDAAKAQYQKFFERFVPLLKPDGIIITDNILFHGCVANNQRQTMSKNVRHMATKVDQYNHFLTSLPEYQTYFINVGDGLAITMRKVS